MILRTETLLYAQAFFAVNHINFINPNAYKPERYVLKGHAIQKIKDKLKDADAATSDGNLGAVLCMASAAHLEVSSPELCPFVMKTSDGRMSHLQQFHQAFGPFFSYTNTI